jgi:hypothetical protein
MSGPSPLSDTYKLTWSGVIGSDEIFSYSRWTTFAGSHAQETIIDDFTGDVADMLATTVTLGGIPTLAQGFPSYVEWTQLKCSPWDNATDKLESGQTPAYRTLTDVGTGSASAGLPNQCAWAMTTRSAESGRRKYNRFYLPTFVVQTTDGGGLVGVEETNAFALWLHLNITARASTGENMVNHNGKPSPSLPATDHAMLDIYLGRRMDVIRRRANPQPEPRVVDVL